MGFKIAKKITEKRLNYISNSIFADFLLVAIGSGYYELVAQGFAYRINISWWIFLAAGVSAILIALITVGSQAIKAAIANPVKSLRTE
jgi:ABC-type antimicrobial peptide transport system permease subunit